MDDDDGQHETSVSGLGARTPSHSLVQPRVEVAQCHFSLPVRDVVVHRGEGSGLTDSGMSGVTSRRDNRRALSDDAG